MVNKWLIINTLSNERIITRTLRDLRIDTSTINAGNLSVTARCHLGVNMDDLLIKCYISRDTNRKQIYGCMLFKEELAVFSPSGNVEYIDISISRWVEGEVLSTLLDKPNSNFAELSRRFDILGYSLLQDELVHCDIKPENIVVNLDGSMSLIDNDAWWNEDWSSPERHELGTYGYRAITSEKYTPAHYLKDYPIALISIILAALSWEYDTVRPLIHNEILFNPGNDRRFHIAMESIKGVFKRAGDDIHYAICEIITPRGINGQQLMKRMHDSVYMRTSFERSTGFGPIYDL